MQSKFLFFSLQLKILTSFLILISESYSPIFSQSFRLSVYIQILFQLVFMLFRQKGLHICDEVEHSLLKPFHPASLTLLSSVSPPTFLIIHLYLHCVFSFCLFWEFRRPDPWFILFMPHSPLEQSYPQFWLTAVLYLYFCIYTFPIAKIP